MAEKTKEPPADEGLLKDGIEYEEVSADDRVIGRAFRVSLAVLIGVGALGALAYWWLNRTEDKPPPRPAEVSAPLTVTRDANVPVVRFTDVTQASGIDFVHERGAEGEKLLPETMGAGVAFVDHDQDGDADLILVNGTFWPGSKREGARPTQALYANDGAGHFTNASAASGLATSFYGMGVACADADGDGDPDAFFTAVGPDHYFANEGGTFREADVGVAGSSDGWSTCACFFDAERDGDLDLYVGNYIRWSREIDLAQNVSLTGIDRAYGQPTSFEGAQPYFYRNDDGRFGDVAQAAGLHVVNSATGVPVGKALGVRACDTDLDGDLDLAVANDTVANFFYRNEGDGKFVESAQALSLAYDREGRSTGAMGIDAAWFRNDDAIGIAIGNFANEMTSFYVTQGSDSHWADEAIGTGIGAPTRKYLKFGTLFLDYDLDGRPDLLQANGHLEPEINQVQVSQTYEQSAQLFWNAGAAARRTFVEVDAKTLGDLVHPIVGRGAAAADVDGDGDLDLLLTQSGGRPLLLENEQALGNHWVRLALVGTGKNREAIGARVQLVAGGVKQCQDLVPFRSYLSQNELVLTFGIGPATAVDSLNVTWPDGTKQTVNGVGVDRLTRVVQGP